MINDKVDVLPGTKGPGFVRLVSFMQPAMGSAPSGVVQDEDWTGDLEIVRNARVSYNADWRAGQDAGKDEKLIKYLHDNRHTSPFEAMVFTFEVKAPIFVFRQWHRHRTWSYNEVSARYAELDEGFYIPDEDKITTQSKDNKQMRTFQKHPAAEWARGVMEASAMSSFTAYKNMLDEGVPRELARSVLPVSAYSRMFATVDLHNLFHFIQLRCHSHAQYEIRVYAEAILGLIKPICPAAVQAFWEGQMIS